MVVLREGTPVKKEEEAGNAAKRVPRDMSSAISAPELFANSRQPLHQGGKSCSGKKANSRNAGSSNASRGSERGG